MDTKSKKWRYSAFFKGTALIAGALGMVLVAYALMQMSSVNAIFTAETFTDSYVLRNKLDEARDQVQAAFHYESATKIQMGETIDSYDLAQKQADIGMEKAQAIDEAKRRYDEWIATAEERGDMAEVTRLKVEAEKQADRVEASYESKLLRAREDLIVEQMTRFRELVETLKTSDVYFYVPLNGNQVYTNIGSDVIGPDPAKPFVKDVTWTGFKTKAALENHLYGLKHTNQYSSEYGTIIVALKPDTYLALEKDYNERLEVGRYWFQAVAAGFSVFLLAWVYLLYASGRRVSDDGEVHLGVIDRLFLDIGLAFAVGIIGCCIALLPNMQYLDPRNQIYHPGSLLVFIGTIVGYIYTISFMKRIKRREVIRHTFIGYVFGGIIRWFKGIGNNITSYLTLRTSLKKVIIAFILYALGAFAIIGFTGVLISGMSVFGLFVGLAMFGGYHLWVLKILRKYLEGFEKLLDGTKRISDGELDHRIEVEGLGDLGVLAYQVNNMTEGLGKAVENEVKAERLKSELISNVSHDLRTPLTVIRTYVDLLKTEGLDSPDAPKYLEVLEEKSLRLQKLTEDLFDAAKASTGSIPVHLERVDLRALVEQSMGELSDGMNASGLQFVTKFSDDELWVMADGGLLSRVLENLFVNVFKYAMPGSRVYVQAERSEAGFGCSSPSNSASINNASINSNPANDRTGSMCCFTIKNTSAESLNMPADELLLRFKRGDAARSTEGSGLGLAIAKSLVENQGGVFELTVDGDLFKVRLCLKNA